MRCSYKAEVRMFFRLFFFITACLFDSYLAAIECDAERAPRQDLSSGLAPCNPCVSDLETIAQELCLLRSELTACAPTPLSQAHMPVTLSIDDQAYCVTEELTGNITIDGDDITINLDDHTVNGHIIINGARAIVRGGKVVAPAPVDNTEANSGVINIAASGENTQIIDVYISAQDGTVAGVNGARGIDFSTAPGVMVQNCVVIAGKGGPVNGVSDGGIGISGSGSSFILENSEVTGGAGSDSTDGTITTGNGGRGIDNAGGALYSVYTSMVKGGDAGSMSTTDDVGGVALGNGGTNRIDALVYSIQDSTFIAGSGGSVVTTGSIGVGGAVTGGGAARALQTVTGNIVNGLISDSRILGGTSVSLSGVNIGVSGAVTQGSADTTTALQMNRLLLENSIVRGGSAGSIIASGVIGNGAAVTAGSGGNGISILNSGAELVINNSRVTGGNSATLSAGGLATSSNVVHGNGGIGVNNNAGGKLSIDASTIRGGFVPSITMGAGNVGSAGTSFTMGSGGAGFNNAGSTSVVSVEHSTIIGGDSAGLSTPGLVNNVIAGAAGHAVNLVQAATAGTATRPEVVIFQSQIFGGKIGDIAGGTIASLAPVTGNNGGNGINIAVANSGFTTLHDSTISTYRGADLTGAAGGGARTGGTGGIGVNLNGNNINDVIIADNVFLQTGRGGNVTAGVGGIGGNGGVGIFVSANTAAAELSKNTIAYTGAGGTGAVVGTDGVAINSLSAAVGMIVYGNYAHNVANATPFNIVAGNIDGAVTGTAYAAAAGTNFLFNIHKP